VVNKNRSNHPRFYGTVPYARHEKTFPNSQRLLC
jgi:hypothetical protein